MATSKRVIPAYALPSPVRRKGVVEKNRTHCMTSTKPFFRSLWVTISLATLISIACAQSSIECIAVPPNAQGVHRQRATGSGSTEISYNVELPYPQTSVTSQSFTDLKSRGWSKCSGYDSGWTSHVDASPGVAHERTVFQNVSYWSKGKALLSIVMIYYAGTTPQGAPLAAPTNAKQFVAITEDFDPSVKSTLKLMCTG